MGVGTDVRYEKRRRMNDDDAKVLTWPKRQMEVPFSEKRQVGGERHQHQHSAQLPSGCVTHGRAAGGEGPVCRRNARASKGALQAGARFSSDSLCL